MLRNWCLARTVISDTDALAWQTAAIANGGTVSAPTLAAVSAFITSAKANGYWTKINRLNLFCGTGLGAALTPQKVGGGSATETNVNFVSGDYSESTGLTGNASNKYLNTGLLPSVSLTLNDTHLAIYNRSSGTTGASLGSYNAAAQCLVFQAPFQGVATAFSDQYNDTNGAGRLAAGSVATPFGFMVASRTGAAAHSIYRNASSLATNAGSGGSMPTLATFVGAYNNVGTPSGMAAAAMGAYSIGSGLSAGDVTNYYTDMQAFQTSLARQV